MQVVVAHNRRGKSRQLLCARLCTFCEFLCGCIQLGAVSVFMQYFLQIKSSISKHKIHILIKLSPSVSVSLEQNCIFNYFVYLLGCVVSQLRHAGSSLCHSESSVAVHKLSSYGLKSQYLQHIGLVALWPVGFHFPDQGMNPCPPALQGGLFTAGPPGKSQDLLFQKKHYSRAEYTMIGLPWWLSQQRTCLQSRRPGFDPWVWKILWRREWPPTPVFLPGEFHGAWLQSMRSQRVRCD